MVGIHVGVPSNAHNQFNANSVLQEDLRSWWTLDEASGVRVDSHGLGSDLAAINGPGNQVGIVDEATLLVPASSQYLETQDRTLHQVWLPFSHTWWAIDTAIGSGSHGLFDSWASADGNVGIYWRVAASGNWQFRVGHGDGTSTTTNVGAMPAGWHHYGVTYDGVNDINLYFDGALLMNITDTVAPFITTGKIPQWGRRGGGEFLPGGHDNMTWHTEVIPLSSIQLLYNGGSGIRYQDIF